MRKIRSWYKSLHPESRLFIVSFVTGAVIIVIIYVLFDTSTWKSIWPDLVATLVAVIVGIPVAIGLTRFQQLISEKERKHKVLNLLENELKENQDALELFFHDVGWSKDGVLYNIKGAMNLRNELWKAISDGGELECIKDLELLSAFADTYTRVRLIKEFSDFLLKLVLTGYHTDDNSELSAVGKSLVHEKENLKTSIESSLAKITYITGNTTNSVDDL